MELAWRVRCIIGRLAVAMLIVWILMASLWFGGASEFASASSAATPSEGESSRTSSGGGGASPPTGGGGGDSGGGDTSSAKRWRESLLAQCESASSVGEVLAVGKAARGNFALPSSDAVDAEVNRRASEGDDAQLKRCKLAVMDYGANVGDTMAHMMDAGLVRCEKTVRLGGNVTSESHFDQAEFALEEKRWNRVTGWLVGMVDDVSKAGKNPVGPEDYCYYGVEGNPVFTERLKRAEAWAGTISPKPLRHAHILTEHVGAGKDGLTQLWLDTVNTKENFWGSSIYKTHWDVKKSSTNSTAKAADVEGITITTLMRKTLNAFDPNASEEDKKGGHLLLKVDIEGGEYPLIEEVRKSNILCDYVKMGNRADLLIEFHFEEVTGVSGLDRKAARHRKKLEKCGVKFRELQAWWH